MEEGDCRHEIRRSGEWSLCRQGVCRSEDFIVSVNRDLKCGKRDMIDSSLQDMAAHRFQVEGINMIQNLDTSRGRMNCTQYAALLLYDTSLLMSKGIRLSSYVHNQEGE
jgi:hypothetical protein